MRKAAVTQKTQEAEAAATMDKIEAQARQQVRYGQVLSCYG